MNDPEKREETSWNIVAEQSKFISQLLQEATKHYLDGNIGEWFNTLTAIRENINYDLTNTKKGKDGKNIKGESEILDEISNECWNLQGYWNRHKKIISEGKTSPKELVAKKKEYVDSVRKYQRKLLEILNSLGYFPKKEDRKKLSF